MAFDEELAARVRKLLARHNATERKMFGGLAFMVNGHMCCGLGGNGDLMVRVGPEKYDEALKRPNTRVMDFTGRPMKGYIYLEPLGYQSEKELKDWVKRAVDFVSSLPPK